MYVLARSSSYHSQRQRKLEKVYLVWGTLQVANLSQFYTNFAEL